MKLYDTDYLLKNANNEYVKDIYGNYVIYSEGARDEEVIHNGDEWVKTTELPTSIQQKLIEQLTMEEE
jgi:glycyl-tRNA synthetase beta subunit